MPQKTFTEESASREKVAGLSIDANVVRQAKASAAQRGEFFSHWVEKAILLRLHGDKLIEEREKSMQAAKAKKKSANEASPAPKSAGKSATVKNKASKKGRGS